MTFHFNVYIIIDTKKTLEYLLHRNPGLLGLSEVQLELLRMLAEGCTDKEIAAQKRVSPSTVRNHREKSASWSYSAPSPSSSSPADSIRRRRSTGCWAASMRTFPTSAAC